jgi:D-arabinose 1-dehydrogenase-like Zn-dependent alcohol dehydrogenase
MKAAVVERPGILTVREVPDPVPGEYDALCELLYGATCTGTDTHIIRGEFPFPLAYPAVLGHESVGRVIRTGRKVRTLAVGDLVTRVGTTASADGSLAIAWGGFAELGLAHDHAAMREDGLPAQSWDGARVNQVVPASVDPRAAPMFTTWRETLSYVMRIGIGPGTRLLVIGSGGNGLSFAAHASHRGAAAIWVVGSARSTLSARAVGVTGFVDYRSGDCSARLHDVCPQGFDVIIDAVGRAGQADRYLPHLASGGKIGIYGLDDFAGITLSPRLARGSFTVWNGGYDEAETHHEVSALAVRGTLDARIWYDVENPWPLASILDAFRSLWRAGSRAGAEPGGPAATHPKALIALSAPR